MGRARPAHRCSHPDCNGQAVADVIMYKRDHQYYRNVWTYSKVTMNHIYLCEKHYPDMHEFLNAYEGGDAVDNND